MREGEEERESVRDGLALFNYCFLGVGRTEESLAAVRLISRPLSSRLELRTPQSLTVRLGVLESIYVVGGEMDIAPW